MFPFWEIAIAPVLEAAGATRITEIGALAGQTTELMLTRLGPKAELHVIDPVPQFDPSEHERRFKGQYIFHRDLSLNVIKTLDPMDAVLIDGDHNWYTVYHELQQIAHVSANAGAPLPVLILHDVCYPYGRRDLYYAPEQIPDAYRQPYAQRGMIPGRKDLARAGGLNPSLYNAIDEGGPRNGVMTALEDFIEEHDEPLRLVVLPVYFGLAVVATQERVERQPELARVLDELEGIETRDALLELSEETRIKSLLFQHNVFHTRERQLREGAARHLDLLKGALLDDHYLENEARIDYLLLCLEHGRPLDPRKLRDPERNLKDRLVLIRRSREHGGDRDGGETGAGYFPYTDMGRTRLNALQDHLDVIREERVEGDLVDCGTGRGGGAIFMRGYLEAHGMELPTVYVADPFKAARAKFVPERGELRHPRAWLRRVRRGRLLAPVPGGWGGLRSLLADLNNVRSAFERFDLFDKRVRFLQGSYGGTLASAPIEKVALLRIGSSAREQADEILERLYDKVTVGGIVVVDGYDDPACRRRVDAFREKRGIADQLVRGDHWGAHWRKLGEDGYEPPEPEVDDLDMPEDLTRDLPEDVALPEPGDERAVGTTGKDLSVVVVFYNMKREAERSLRSLSRAYQEEIEDLDYEVLVIENGSRPDQRLGAEYVRSFGPEFRYIDMGEGAPSSPVPALNRGIAEATGENLALMIDGAHVLTPGVLHFGMEGLRTYEPAIVATQQWYVGPGQQGELMAAGYDQTMEDRLFDRIGWPAEGHRLFDIGHFIGERDWFDGLWESNCLFTPRGLVEQSGGFDEIFDMPGGGYANLDIYERLGSTPGVTVATILGEGSFHQFHHGTTTNQDEVENRHRLISSYAEHYEAERGKVFAASGKPIHYVGRLFEGATRTRSRRFVARAFWTPQSTEGRDGVPDEPQPMPQEVAMAFTEAFWHSLAWKETTWLGEAVPAAPTDLVVYQELLSRVRPDWVVITSGSGPGIASFVASICDLLDHGRVLVVGDDGGRSHPRLERIGGRPADDATREAVAERVGDGSAFVILGGPKHRDHTIGEFKAYAPLVPVGSYVVVERSVVNGAPVWPGFGPGPQEAIRLLKQDHPEFMSDLEVQRYALTLNANGFLKRVR